MLHKLKSVFILVLIILIGSFPLNSHASQNVQEFDWKIGEALTYNVKWGMLHLGILRFTCLDTVNINGTTLYKTEINVDSNRNLLFINIHNTYTAYLEKNLNLHLFIADEHEDGFKCQAQYKINYLDSLINVTMESGDSLIKNEKIPLKQKVYDMAALIYYARQNAGQDKNTEVMAFFNTKPAPVDINFYKEHRNSRIRRNSRIFPAHYIDGKFHNIGIFGVRGGFKGWFSTSEDSVPLRAKLQVFLGNITLELDNLNHYLAQDL